MSNVTPPKKSRKTLWIVLALVAVVLLCSCLCCPLAGWFYYRSAARPSSSSGDSSSGITAPEETVTVKIAEAASGGKMAISRLPTNFPKDIPVYRGAKIIMGVNPKDGTGSTMFTVTAKASTVATFYKDKMPSEGWDTAEEMNVGDGTMLGFSKDDGKRKATIVINSTGAESSVSITFEDKK